MIGVAELVPAVVERAPLAGSWHHGELHWQAVGHAGAELLPHVPGCDPEVLFLFALFHDAQRENEHHDPGHGRRGSALARELHGRAFDVGAERLELLCQACDGHTDVERSDDPTIGACWDADRLNLWRVAIAPVPRFLSTAAARNPELVSVAATWHGARYGWDALARRYGIG
ncbi:MAG TPA: hypothetical protein VM290_12040 [Gaiellaceae bacterium]|nr:hypothetical protein [Gaiellaceae bacterium]